MNEMFTLTWQRPNIMAKWPIQYAEKTKDTHTFNLNKTACVITQKIRLLPRTTDCVCKLSLTEFMLTKLINNI